MMPPCLCIYRNRATSKNPYKSGRLPDFRPSRKHTGPHIGALMHQDGACRAAPGVKHAAAGFGAPRTYAKLVGMPTSLIIVDDFLDEPQPLRDAALRLSYPDLKGAFPGRNSVERINIEGLDQAVSRLVGEPVQGQEYPQSHAKCRITLAADRGRAKVHVDPSHWSGILYLSRPEDCRGGTEFFRHRATGTERAPYNDEEAARYGYPSAKEMVDRIITDDGKDESREGSRPKPKSEIAARPGRHELHCLILLSCSSSSGTSCSGSRA